MSAVGRMGPFVFMYTIDEAVNLLHAIKSRRRVETLPRGFVIMVKDVCATSAANSDRFIPEERSLQYPLHTWLGLKRGSSGYSGGRTFFPSLEYNPPSSKHSV
jgi:hypothetical protein